MLLPGVLLCLLVGGGRGSCAGMGRHGAVESLRQRRSPRRERAKRAVAEKCRFEETNARKSRVIGVVGCVISLEKLNPTIQ